MKNSIVLVIVGITNGIISFTTTGNVQIALVVVASIYISASYICNTLEEKGK